MTGKQKNLIIITADEMRGDCTGYAGNPDIKTPHLDSFAQRGITFANHFTCHGKCVPSRIALMTGRYSHTDGYRTIHEHLAPSQPNLLGHLKKLGYQSALFGHNHVWEEFWGDNSYKSGYTDYTSYTEGVFSDLQKVHIAVPQPSPHFKPVVMEDGYDYKGLISDPRSGFTDDIRTEQALLFLREVRDPTKPFFLQVNFANPHPPYKAEEPYYSMYDRSAIHPWPYRLPTGAPLPLQKMREVRTDVHENEMLLREIQALYYGMVTKVDSMTGRILDCIRELKLMDDTIVLFTSDHGDYAGQYGLVEKWDTSMADCLLHVPFIMHYPGCTKGVMVDSLTEHVDVVPTLETLMGLELDWGTHGYFLPEVVAGTEKRSAVFANGGHEYAMIQRARDSVSATGNDGTRKAKQETYKRYPQTMARTKMVRTHEWKLVIRLEGGNELYNMAEDPYEMNNLYGESRYAEKVNDLQLKMIQWCLATDTDRPYQELIGA